MRQELFSRPPSLLRAPLITTTDRPLDNVVFLELGGELS
jgi:hypothetical protein